jgi:hypothetical protein
MQKLVFDYTYCSEPESFEWNLPFEYESKEKFIFDVLENPMVLNKIGIEIVYQFMVDDKSVYKKDYIEDIDDYVLTLEEWFEKNKVVLTNKK